MLNNLNAYRFDSHRFVKIIFASFLLCFISLVHAQQTTKKLVLAGPAAGVSYPLVHMVENDLLSDIADEVEFILWNNPDQLRALVLSTKADFVAAPTNVVANLYNRGAPIKLLNVSQWGVLWMVSRNPDLKTLADFKDQEIVIPFRADMPDIVFSTLVEHQGLSLKNDFKISYSATPLDAMQLLITRRADNVLLAEPAVSMALRKTKSFPTSIIAPELFRSVDLQQEWGVTMHTEPRIPQAGIAVLGDMVANHDLIKEFLYVYEKANLWCYENASACADEVAKHIKLLTPEAVSDSLEAQSYFYASAASVAEEINKFFQVLSDKNPATIGGKLPDGNFIYNY